jgi:hypothetical protein
VKSDDAVEGEIFPSVDKDGRAKPRAKALSIASHVFGT